MTEKLNVPNIKIKPPGLESKKWHSIAAKYMKGYSSQVKQFPVVFNDEHIMNIYLKHLGKTPEDKYSYGVRILPPECRDKVDFYHRELENITIYTMEIFETQTNHEKYNRNELIEMWGIDWIKLYPFERQIGKDNWVCGQVGFKWIITYKIRILDTKEMFAIRIIYTRVP